MRPLLIGNIYKTEEAERYVDVVIDIKLAVLLDYGTMMCNGLLDLCFRDFSLYDANLFECHCFALICYLCKVRLCRKELN